MATILKEEDIKSNPFKTLLNFNSNYLFARKRKFVVVEKIKENHHIFIYLEKVKFIKFHSLLNNRIEQLQKCDEISEHF